MDHEDVWSSLSPLIGLPLTDMWRYAGMQKFEFGEQRPFINRKGEEASQADWGLVVNCRWRLDGAGGFTLSSEHFGAERLDEHAFSFYDSLAVTPPVVRSVEVGGLGSLQFAFSSGYSLFIEPDSTTDFEDWRLMPPEEDPRGHLVLDTFPPLWSGSS